MTLPSKNKGITSTIFGQGSYAVAGSRGQGLLSVFNTKLLITTPIITSCNERMTDTTKGAEQVVHRLN